jgi:hypothetical protein
MLELKILLTVISVICLFISIINLSAYTIFERFPHLTAKIGATLQDTIHKKNVRLRTKNSSFFVKDLTKGLYVYYVNGKYYKVKETHLFCTEKQAPYMIPIVYIKRFPRLRYINTIGSFSKTEFLINGLLSAFTSIMFFVMVVAF